MQRKILIRNIDLQTSNLLVKCYLVYKIVKAYLLAKFVLRNLVKLAVTILVGKSDAEKDLV